MTTTGPTIWTPDKIRQLAEACGDDFPRLAYDGFGIMLTDQQVEAYHEIGKPGPRMKGEAKYNWLSGGQRAGKTVLAMLMHADAALYKRGVDTTDGRFWRNYRYATLAIAPTTELTLRLWTIGDEVAKGSSDAQYERSARRARGGAFLGQFKAGKVTVGGVAWPAWRFANGSIVDFRSSEGYAYRLEGGQWWWITWDEWASQPDREIRRIRVDVLMGRARDHDAKIMPMAWPKPETEHHLIAVQRDIEAGRDLDSRVVFLEADQAYFTNTEALAVELRQKTKAEVLRTIKGRPAGGGHKEFKEPVIENMVRADLPAKTLPEEGYAYFDSWDLGVTNDATTNLTWRIPIIGGRRVVSPEFKARIVNHQELPGSDERTLPDITQAIAERRLLYHSTAAVDATGMGGVMAVRELRELGGLLEFKSRSNDRVWGNMRLAAITNGLDCASWGFDPEAPGLPWGLFEMPRIVPLIDQLANFDRDAKNVPDDWVWSFLIGAWYIRRNWAVGRPGVHAPRVFDVRGGQADVTMRRRGYRDQRSRLIGAGAPPGTGQVFIKDGVRYTPRRG